MQQSDTSTTAPPRSARRTARSTIFLTVLALGFVVVPFLFWEGIWFGRPLEPEEIDRYLKDEEHPRKIQHGLSQVAEHIMSGDPESKRWYPRIVELAGNPTMQVRVTVAWTMGQDENSQVFHDTLLQLLKDRELMVRRNAALSLVRFRDSSGRGEVLRMLAPYTIAAPQAGAVSVRLKPDQEILTGTLLARITSADGKATEVRSPFSGRVNAILPREGAAVNTGDPLVSIRPGDDQVWEALRGLYLIGQPEDLQTVEQYERSGDSATDRIRQQAVLTAQSIRTRAERNSSH